MFKIKKPICCLWISDTSWDNLSLKEKDYIIFLYSKRFTKEQIMRKLHIEDRTAYWRLQTRVKDKIKDDVVKYNDILKNSFKCVIKA